MELNLTINAMMETMLVEMDVHLNVINKMAFNALKIRMEYQFVNLNKIFASN
jgi:hypothetical protein